MNNIQRLANRLIANEKWKFPSCVPAVPFLIDFFYEIEFCRLMLISPKFNFNDLKFAQKPRLQMNYFQIILNLKRNIV